MRTLDGEPLAVTLNCAVPPAATVCATGAVAMVGALGGTTCTVAPK